MTTHPLDRPVWSALTTQQAALASGGALAKRIDPAIGLFAAARDDGPASLAALAALIARGGSVGTVEVHPQPQPPGTDILSQAICWQMTTDAITPGEPDFVVTPLTDSEAPAMLALATLTRPGPFFAHTNRLGGFVGVKQHGALIAMAGQRLSMPGFTEVSGVCTHPDHRGHGYAAGLMRLVARAILARGDTPFLHAYADNRAATALYERLGFRLRREMTFTMLAKL